MRIVHLPFYDDNPYQTLLMDSQRELGHDVWAGGGGGNFIGVALRDWKADLVHFHWLHPYLLRETNAASLARASRFLIEIILLKIRGAKIAWTIHNLVNHDGKHPFIEQRYSALFAKLCDHCFVHSRAAADAAVKRFGIPAGKLSVIPHGHYIGFYPDSISREEARKRLELSGTALVFLFLGRIEPYKGVFELIEAFKELPDNCRLIIAGKVVNSDLIPELESRVATVPEVQLHARRIPDCELQTFYNGADVVVFPFRNILTSGSLVLAMSFGKVVVAPRIPSLEEIVPADGVRWFTPGVAGSLAAAMNKWNSKDLTVSGRCNLTCARSWNWSSIAKINLRPVIPNGTETEVTIE